MPGNLFLRCFSGLALIVLALFASADDAESQVYVAYRGAGIVNKYDVDTGALTTERFIEGLSEPHAICLDNSVLYVLQANGVIGKYDAKSGAALNDHFISGLRMPQAMAVRDGAIYVSSFAWPYQHDLGQGYGNLIGKYDEATGACIKPALLQTDHLAGSIAVSGQDLFVADAGTLNPNGPAVFNTTTGAPIQRKYQPMLNGAKCVTATGDWIWFTAGFAQYGMIFKYSATGDANGLQRSMIGYFQPLVKNMNAPSFIAVSGEEIFVGSGSGTGVAKYNATTGDVIKADFIPDRSDHFGGIAVAPRAASGAYAMADTQFAVKNTLLDWLFWGSTNGSALYMISAIIVVLAIGGLALVYHYRSPGPSPELAAGASPDASGDAVLVDAAAISRENASAQPPAPPVPVAPSLSGMAWLAFFAVLLLGAGTLAWFASQSVDLTHLRPDHTPDLIGEWGIDPNEGVEHNPPVYYDVHIYPNHFDYQAQGRPHVRLDGQWRNDGFWYAKPDGSGEVEVCHLNDPLDLNIHLSAFDSGGSGDFLLYKERGSDEEMAALKDKYPQPITYPPPAGVIKFWMSEYELNNLPWHADHVEEHMNEPIYSRGRIWVYHSDNPQVSELRVTVKDHRVVEVSGGNG